MAKKEKKPKKGYTFCKDCGKEYMIGAPHHAFCEAKTCSECGTTYSYVIPVYDSRVKPPVRKCEECLGEELDRDDDTIYEDDCGREHPGDDCR